MRLHITRFQCLVIFGLILGTACGDNADSGEARFRNQEQLTIYAAASLTEAFQQLGQQFEAAQPNAEVVISFAGSQQIAQQLSQGAPGDLFASADEKQMINVINSGRVIEGSEQEFVHNKLVVILPSDNPGGINGLGDLASSDLELILADQSVPVGAYAQEMLQRAEQDPRFGTDFKSNVLRNVVSYEENVRAVLTKIILGEADAGIVYASDAAGAPGTGLQVIPIPDEINIIASYFIAPIADSPNDQLAQDFISLVLSPQGQEILSDYGFAELSQHE
ncbi:MAG: molybdate ABC transporter substrate-binding protein [Anaerolineales bacterium]